MTDSFQLPHAPTIEAVVDIDCDLPPNLDFEAVNQKAFERFKDTYPHQRRSIVQGHEIRPSQESLSVTIQRGLGALQFRSEDEKQLIQIRWNGFSFNRLKPYSSLDDYLAEIETRWETFKQIVQPIQLRKIGLRYINRIALPCENGQLDLRQYLTMLPVKPDCSKDGFDLQMRRFVHQHQVHDEKSGLVANIILASEEVKNNRFPIILDLEALSYNKTVGLQWVKIAAEIQQLRSLKNSLFRNLLTESCLNLFQHPQS